MEKPRRLVSFANAFGALGYVSVFFQWTWALLLILYPIFLANPDFLTPQPSKEMVVQPLKIDPGFTPIVTGVAIAVTVIVLVAAVIAIIRMPRAIGKKASALTQATTNRLIPIVTHHKKVTKKKRLKLSKRVAITIKLLVMFIPLAMLLVVPSSDQLSRPAIWMVGLFAVACSLFYFSVQVLIAWAGKIAHTELW